MRLSMGLSANKQAVCEVVTVSQRVGIDAIANALPHIPRRTLQRLLGELVEGGLLARTGKGRATVYSLIAAANSAATPDDYTTYIQLSDASRDLLVRLRKPLAARTPVAYERDWLAAYEPNKTFYLDEHTRGREPGGHLWTGNS
jgi:hypothetical protein